MKENITLHKLKRIIFQYNSNLRFNQAFSLFSVGIISIPIGIITSIALTDYLGPSDYGNYKFIFSVISLAISVFSFGFYQAGSRALILNHNVQKAKELYGAELFLTAIMYLMMAICFIIYAISDSTIQNNKLEDTFLSIIPFCWIFLFSKYIEIMIKADNKINLLSKSRIYPQIGFLIVIYIFIFFSSNINLEKLNVVLYSYIGTQILFFIYALHKIKISFNNLKIRIIEIWNYNKSYGLQIYFGSLMAVGLMSLTEILISYFGIDNSGVGFYSLALTFSSPIALIPNTLGTIFYRDFANQNEISKKVIITSISLSIIAIFCLWIIIGPFINYFFDVSYSSVIKLCYIVSIGVTMQGFGDLFNCFLGANGHGKEIRNSAILVGSSLLILNLIFIPMYGELGAAITKVIVGILYFICMLWYYIKLRTK